MVAVGKGLSNMKIFVLIIILNSGDKSAIDHIEFSSKDACLEAAKAVAEISTFIASKPYIYCIEK